MCMMIALTDDPFPTTSSRTRMVVQPLRSETTWVGREEPSTRAVYLGVLNRERGSVFRQGQGGHAIDRGEFEVPTRFVVPSKPGRGLL